MSSKNIEINKSFSLFDKIISRIKLALAKVRLALLIGSLVSDDMFLHERKHKIFAENVYEAHTRRFINQNPSEMGRELVAACKLSINRLHMIRRIRRKSSIRGQVHVKIYREFDEERDDS